jgi:hypothetical protein
MKSMGPDKYPIREHDLWSTDNEYELLCVYRREVLNHPNRVFLIGRFLARTVNEYN